MKKIFILLTVIVSAVAFGQVVFADNANVYVSPATASKNVGVAFNIVVKVDPQGNKVCLVKGALSFSNLTCQSITTTSGIMAQTYPTCDNPSFNLGIQKCATVAKGIFTVSVKGNNVGQGKVSITLAKVLGAGTVVAFSENNGVEVEEMGLLLFPL